MDIAPQSGETLAEWIMRMLEYARSVQLVAGKDTLIEISLEGSRVSYLPARSLFVSPFFPTLTQTGVTLAQGFVNDVEPVITSGGKSVPISGNSKKNIAQPVLKISSKAIDATTQTSYVALEIEADKEGRLTLDSDGKLASGLRLEVVHTAKLTDRTVVNPTGNSGGKVAVKALAMIVWQGDNAAEIIPIRRHNQEYVRTFPKEGEGAVRHFLYAT